VAWTASVPKFSFKKASDGQAPPGGTFHNLDAALALGRERGRRLDMPELG